MSTQTSPIALLKDFGDRFSPLVVKELRQGLRTRFFTTALMLFHFGIVALLASVLLKAPLEAVNGIFWAASGIMLLIVLPLRGFNALNGERADGTMDMLVLTSISSFRILQGKWVAIFSQVLLVAGSLLPYMVARYYFGGVEIVREGVALVVLVLGSGIVSAALLAFSSQASLLLRLALLAAVGFAACPLWFFAAFLVGNTNSDSMLRAFAALHGVEQTGLVVGTLLLAVYCVWYFLALGASRIAPPSENHSTRKRLVVLVAHLVLLGVGLVLLMTTTRAQGAIFALIPLIVLTLLTCMDVLTEEMPRFPTAVQKLAGKGRLLGRLLHPGWASGVPFATLLCVICLILLLFIEERLGSSRFILRGPVGFLHLVCVAAFVPVVLRVNRKNLFANWWVVQICMGAVCVFLALFTVATGARDGAALGVFTPITTLFAVEAVEHSSRDGMMVVGFIFSLVWLAGAFSRALAEFSVYTALELEVRQLATESFRTNLPVPPPKLEPAPVSEPTPPEAPAP